MGKLAFAKLEASRIAEALADSDKLMSMSKDEYDKHVNILTQANMIFPVSLAIECTNAAARRLSNMFFEESLQDALDQLIDTFSLWPDGAEKMVTLEERTNLEDYWHPSDPHLHKISGPPQLMAVRFEAMTLAYFFAPLVGKVKTLSAETINSVKKKGDGQNIGRACRLAEGDERLLRDFRRLLGMLNACHGCHGHGTCRRLDESLVCLW